MTRSFNSTSKSVCLTNVLNPDAFMLSQRPQLIVTSTTWKPLSLQQQSRAGGAAAQRQEFRPPARYPIISECCPPLYGPRWLSPSHLNLAKSKRACPSSPQAALYTSPLLYSHWPGFYGLFNGCCSKKPKVSSHKRKGELILEGRWQPLLTLAKSSPSLMTSSIYLFIYCYCGPFLSSLLTLLQYCFCFMFWFFGHETCGISAPWPEMEPTPPALEGGVLTTGQPGKSHDFLKGSSSVRPSL